MTNNIVKVRGRQGTKSLDITIPAKVSEEHNIKAGDLFKVEIKNKDETLIIEYELIYKNK